MSIRIDMSPHGIKRSITTPLASIPGNRGSTSAINDLDEGHAGTMRGHVTTPKVVVPLSHLRSSDHVLNHQNGKSRHRVGSAEAPSSSASSIAPRVFPTDLSLSSLEQSYSGQSRRQQPIRALKVLRSVERNDFQHDTPPSRRQKQDTDWTPPEDANMDYLSFGSSSGLSDDGHLSPSRASTDIRPDSRPKRKFSASPSSSLPELPLDERCRKSVKRESLGLGRPQQQSEDFTEAMALTPSDPQSQDLDEIGFVEIPKPVEIPKSVGYSRMQRNERRLEKEIAALTKAYEEALEQPARKSSARDGDPRGKSPRTGRSHNKSSEGKSNNRASKETEESAPMSTARAPGADDGIGLMISVQASNALSPRDRHRPTNILASASRPIAYNSKAKTSFAEARRQSGDPPKSSSTDSKASKALPLLKRREVDIPVGNCECDHLHPYFAQPGLKHPKFAEFPGSIFEFLAHAKQVVECHGHDRMLTQNCRTIVRRGSEQSEVNTLPAYFVEISVSAD